MIDTECVLFNDEGVLNDDIVTNWGDLVDQYVDSTVATDVLDVPLGFNEFTGEIILRVELIDISAGTTLTDYDITIKYKCMELASSVLDPINEDDIIVYYTENGLHP